MGTAADFECMNVPMQFVESKNEKLFVKKPIAIGYNIVKNPDYDNLKLEYDGYIK